MGVVLEVEHLTKKFVSRGREDYLAVDDVSFSVNSGEKLGIIGESGSGKTTVVNMITRLLEVSSGTIRLDGQDITFKKGKELKEVFEYDKKSGLVWYLFYKKKYTLLFLIAGNGTKLLNKLRMK